MFVVKTTNQQINISKSKGTNMNMSSESAVNDVDVKKVKIYRFKIDDDCMEEVNRFSNIHKYDNRKDFKSAWDEWVIENVDLIDAETRRLYNLGYEGDVKQKLFKSARYYFKNKSAEKKVASERRNYISIDKAMLETMDRHINATMFKQDYQPKNGFISFCREHELLVKRVMGEILECGASAMEVTDKIKKTYKNRYYIITGNMGKK